MMVYIRNLLNIKLLMQHFIHGLGIANDVGTIFTHTINTRTLPNLKALSRLQKS